MKTGTKSLLFGVHQFAWHPFTVLLAWIKLFHRRPSFPELVCILIHDWGYWGKANMDDAEGERHPEFAAKLAGRLFGSSYYDLCLYHSRHYAKNIGYEPSLLCWADKVSILYDPWWLYLPRARLSGELAEYKQIANTTGFLPIGVTDRQWYEWIRIRQIQIGKERKGNAVSYANKCTT